MNLYSHTTIAYPFPIIPTQISPIIPTRISEVDRSMDTNAQTQSAATAHPTSRIRPGTLWPTLRGTCAAMGTTVFSLLSLWSGTFDDAEFMAFYSEW
ncbi:MAG: hypothetical protein KDE19_01935 [Caldilineaceae bacterium]|nr:hypothetical protein [Caldilineaceae bacterium]